MHTVNYKGTWYKGTCDKNATSCVERIALKQYPIFLLHTKVNEQTDGACISTPAHAI